MHLRAEMKEDAWRSQPAGRNLHPLLAQRVRSAVGKSASSQSRCFFSRPHAVLQFLSQPPAVLQVHQVT